MSKPRISFSPIPISDPYPINHIPKRVWLQSFKESQGVIKLKGQGIENPDISEFMRSLGKSKYFKKINLEKTRRTKTNAGTVYQFDMSAKVDFSG